MNLGGLYQDAIKSWARAAHGRGHLDHADGAATLDNPLCGDRVAMQVRLDGGRIAALAHDTRGCLLCEAAASLLGQRAPGLDSAGVEVATAAVEGLLKDHAPPPDAWPELAMFAPAAAYPSRHKCVLLPFRALLAAMVK